MPPSPRKAAKAKAAPRKWKARRQRISHHLLFVLRRFHLELKDSDRLIQASIAASTRRDYRVVMWMKKHELAIRSALLTVLADTPDTDVETTQGKQRLQQRMTAAINKVLTDTEGFGGVDAVYFKQFIVQ
jgi:flagellar FliL protein